MSDPNTDHARAGGLQAHDRTLKSRLLHIVAREGEIDPVRAAREVLALEHVSPAVALRIVLALTTGDPRLDVVTDTEGPRIRLAQGVSLHPEREEYAVVDVETTGLALDYCRMTEIAVVVVRGTGEVLDEYSALINPQSSIPMAVVNLTGITDDMVRHAPTAASVLPEALRLLEGRIVVAHSAAFDRRFIAGEVERWGLDAPDFTWLCTKRLARRLLGGQVRSFGLDSLQDHFHIHNPMRHRALGDARATARLLARLIPLAADRGCRTAEDLVTLTKARRTVSLAHRDFDRDFLDSLPDAPGVYRMYDRGGAIVYVGKSVRLRERVWSYFRPTAPKRQHKIARAAHRIEVQETGNELIALLEEARQIRAYEPKLNKKRNNPRGYRYLKVTAERQARLVTSKEIKAAAHRYFGPFPTPCVGRRSVQTLRDVFTLRDHSQGPFPDICIAADYSRRLEALFALLEGRDNGAIDLAREMAQHHTRWNREDLSRSWREAGEVLRSVYTHAAQIGPDVLQRTGLLVLPSHRSDHVLLLGLVRGRPLVTREISRNRRGLRTAVRAFVSALESPTESLPGPGEVEEIRIVDGWLKHHRDDPQWVDLGEESDARELHSRLQTLVSDPGLFRDKLYVR